MRKLLCIILTLLICIMPSLTIVNADDENTLDNNQTNTTNETLDIYERQKELQTQIQDANGELEGVQTELSENLQQVQDLDDKITKTEEEIQELTSKITEIQEEVDKINVKLEKAQKTYEKQKQALETRLVSIYESRRNRISRCNITI